MKLRCDHRSCNRNFEAIANFGPKKILGRQRGSKPSVASALGLQRSTNCAMKTLMLGADQFYPWQE